LGGQKINLWGRKSPEKTLSKKPLWCPEMCWFKNRASPKNARGIFFPKESRPFVETPISPRDYTPPRVKNSESPKRFLGFNLFIKALQTYLTCSPEVTF